MITLTSAHPELAKAKLPKLDQVESPVEPDRKEPVTVPERETEPEKETQPEHDPDPIPLTPAPRPERAPQPCDPTRDPETPFC